MGGREISRPYRVLVFRRRREVFILLAMPPPSLGRAALGVWCGWFKPLPQTTNQRDGSFGLYMPKAYQKNRPFGLWFMWFAWNQTYHNTNDRCEALASLKGCFFMFLFQFPSIYPLNLYFNRNRQIFNILRQKPQEDAFLLSAPSCFILKNLNITDIFELLSSIQVGLECVPEFRHSCRWWMR